MFCPSCQIVNDPAAAICVSCHAPLSRADGALLGGRYELQSCLGKGGMGIVYKAHDRVLNETVAIKLLLGDAAHGAQLAQRFRSEIKLARKVTHRNVCRVHDYGVDGGREYISMQFVEGVDLHSRVGASGGLPADEAFAIAEQIADGLQAIHDEGIVHRDLKTANVMIDRRGIARVMDFGIAKEAQGGMSLTGGHIIGSPEYMSPEQIHSQPLDARSDLYSFGIILFELFTGRVPFSADTIIALLMKHVHEEPPLDGPQAAAIPPAVREVIRKALAKDRAHRHGSARELADELRAARAGGDATAHDGAAGAADTPRRRGRAVWAVLLVTLLAILPVGVWAIRRWLAAAPPPATMADARAVPTATVDARHTIFAIVDARPPPPAIAVAIDARVAPVPPPAPQPVPDRPERACDDGQAAACRAAGDRHRTGDGVARDPRRAAALYRRACDLGAPSGCTWLGILHNNGDGVDKDLAAATELYERGCSGGDGAGCNNLGTMYEFGVIGVAPDATRAAGYYRRACELGDAPGCGNLGIMMLERGRASGGRDEAAQLLRRGCSSGARRACRKLQELGISP